MGKLTPQPAAAAAAPQSEPAPDAPADPLVEALLADSSAPVERIDGIVVARLVGREDESLLIDFPANPTGKPLPARSLVPWSETEIDSEVAVMFEQGSIHRAIVLGKMATVGAHPGELAAPLDDIESEADEEQITLSTNKRLTIRCGKASLTLTPAGKIILRGEYVLTRANGLNRIQGGSVQIN